MELEPKTHPTFWKVWPWRRTVQVLVLLTLFAFPMIAVYSHYLAARQLDKRLEQWDGRLQGEALQFTDGVMRLGIDDGEGGVPTRRPRKAILERARGYNGSPWSAEIADVPLTDPLAGAESGAASWSMSWVLFAGLIIPLILSIVLGRVYCGWICPMGFIFDMADKLRTLIRRGLELNPPTIRIWKGTKYILLGSGFVFALLTGFAVLHYIYPPAILGREAHGFVSAQFERAEGGALGLALAGLTGASVFLLVLIAIELFVAPRFFCQSICPGGALYSLLGRFRPLRVRRIAPTCTSCTLCDKLCPRGLEPMSDQAGMECDNCGVCIDACPFSSLRFRVGLDSGPIEPPKKEKTPAAAPAKVAIIALLSAIMIFAQPSWAVAHHIMGIPHYAYDENYPQAPVLKLVETVGDWEFQLTSYPGNPPPDKLTQLKVFVKDKKTKSLYRKPVTIEVNRRNAFGDKSLVYGPRAADLSENLFNFYPNYPEEGNYEVTLSFEDTQGISSLTFPIVVGSPGSPWLTLGLFTGAIVLLILVIRAIRIKIRRRQLRATA